MEHKKIRLGGVHAKAESSFIKDMYSTILVL